MYRAREGPDCRTAGAASLERWRDVAQVDVDEVHAQIDAVGEVVNRAEGDASRFDQVYQAYKLNPDVTKERIYIETVEEIFSNVEKIIIDEPAGGSGVVPYLPLRELNKSSGGN